MKEFLGPGIQLIFIYAAKKDFPIKGIENDRFYENETDIFLNTLPEEQRSLLQAAIETGELDAHTLRSTIGFTLFVHFQQLIEISKSKCDTCFKIVLLEALAVGESKIKEGSWNGYRKIGRKLQKYLFQPLNYHTTANIVAVLLVE